MVDERPFENVERDGRAFLLPRRKWRELLFIGAMVPDGDLYVRDPSRPMPAFRDPELIPAGVRFRVCPAAGDHVRVEPVD
jgi:hypothetical protein